MFLTVTNKYISFQVLASTRVSYCHVKHYLVDTYNRMKCNLGCSDIYIYIYHARTIECISMHKRRSNFFVPCWMPSFNRFQKHWRALGGRQETSVSFVWLDWLSTCFQQERNFLQSPFIYMYIIADFFWIEREKFKCNNFIFHMP